MVAAGSGGDILWPGHTGTSERTSGGGALAALRPPFYFAEISCGEGIVSDHLLQRGSSQIAFYRGDHFRLPPPEGIVSDHLLQRGSFQIASSRGDRFRSSPPEGIVSDHLLQRGSFQIASSNIDLNNFLLSYKRNSLSFTFTQKSAPTS
uniref:Uncharacterized protein n=1 Tax=Branchiostoma floridae TaxID=7739 RepID=C4A109_BRAFL|eukprot:XP_002585512.1 hypothetical protein BRAFLDRAFT_111930 [Branchiostoma floridae]